MVAYNKVLAQELKKRRKRPEYARQEEIGKPLLLS